MNNTMQKKRVMGWDIGGAYLKAVIIEENQRVSGVYMQACPLWQGIEVLEQAVTVLLKPLIYSDCVQVITMTGELVDAFENKEEGIEQIVQLMQQKIGVDLVIYAGKQGFITAEQLSLHYEAIASANWLATASYMAQQVTSGLLVDIGSTTTDILIVADSQVKALGLTDYARLVSGELIYTGIVRTAVMAVAQQAFFKGQQMGLMAEYFATMADVYRLTGELNEKHDGTDTADGAEKTLLASAKRLSRMTGYDFSPSDLELWQQFAEEIKSQQKMQIKKACERQLNRGLMIQEICLIGAGIGRFLVKQIAAELGVAYQEFTQGIEQTQPLDFEISDCAPATAVALLYNQTPR